MNKDKQERHKQRSEVAGRLLSALTLHSAETIAQLEKVGEQLIQDNPEMSGQMSRVINRLIARTQATPQAVTAMYLLTTEEPPEAIEGTAHEITAKQSDTEEANNARSSDMHSCIGDSRRGDSI